MSDSTKMGVLFASAEAAPFVKTGGLGDVTGSLPQALAKQGANVIVMVPLYSTIAKTYQDKMEHLCDFYVSLGWRNEYCGLERLEHKGVSYLFVDNKRYFDRSYPYGFFDDGERFAFFSKAICESIQHLPQDFTCDILHCNDWHTALAPVFLREFYQGLPHYEHVRTVFSIHNIAFQGQFSDKVLGDILGMSHIPAVTSQLYCDRDSVNFMQGALNYTDAITTVSPTYAAEIQTPAYGEHLDGVLRRRHESLQGIVNGIDTDHFNPETDPEIVANYTAQDRSGKAACKRALQEELGLTVRDDQPLMVMVTRLTKQKGLDLVTYSLDRILSGGVQVAVLGTGDAEYEDALRYFESKYPGQMSARIMFDPALSQRMYAGADMFLMPSLFAPCGLSQLIAMRYGTLPVVRETGGLKDTVIPYNYVTGEGTGFSFANFNGEEMGDAVFRGARLFWDDHDAWNKLVDHAMTQDFSWGPSAKKYMDLYQWLQPEIAAAMRNEAKKPAKTARARKAASAKKTATKASAGKTTEAKKSATAKSTSAATRPAQEKVTKSDAKAPVKRTAVRKTAAKTSSTAKATARTSSEPKPNAEPKPKAEPKPEPAVKPVAKAAAQPTAKRAVTAAKPADKAPEASTATEPATTTAAKATAKKPTGQTHVPAAEPPASVSARKKTPSHTTTKRTK